MKLQSSFRNMFFSLSCICIATGGMLAAINRITLNPIAISKKIKLENAIKTVLPAFDNSPADEACSVAVSEGDSLKIYPAKRNGQLVGAAVESNSMKGFSGEIKIIVGLDTAGRLIDYKVLKHSETPGLGAKIGEWFRTDKNRQSVLGRKLSKNSLKVSKDGGEVDAITGATITSRAFLDAISRAYIVFSDAGWYTSSNVIAKEKGIQQ